MEKRILLIIFKSRIKPFEVPAFRAAISNKVEVDNLLFHHHIDDTTLLYKYPVIQYKCLDDHPSILCLGEGVDEIYKFFEKKDWSITISDRNLDMSVGTLVLDTFNFNMVDYPVEYSLNSWAGLNQKNHKIFNDLRNECDKTEFFEKLIIGNILSMAKGIGWTIEDMIRVKIVDVLVNRTKSFKGEKIDVFDLRFVTNVLMPDFIGLGKGTSRGLGILRRQ